MVALQRAVIRMVRWMCGIKLKDRFPSKELRERLGIDDSIGITTEQAVMVWAYVVKKDDDWVKKCMEYEVEGSRPRERLNRTWTDVVRGLSST